MHKLTIVITSAAVAFLLMPAAHAAVFAEVASASYCPDCPPADRILFDLYNRHEYPFYYVTMVGDQNEYAYGRIKNDYNFYWYPTVFFDGGLDVVLEASENAYVQAIEKNLERMHPDIHVELRSEWIWCPCQQGFFIDVRMVNRMNTSYEGLLRVYATEVNSRWDTYAAEQYHFAFLEFAAIENISLAPYEEITKEIYWDSEPNYPDIQGENENNIAFFAVLFNTTATINYANPPDNNPFNAYAVDAVAVSIPENSPPSVSIVSPKSGYLYILDREIFKFPKTVIIGKKTVEIHAFDESGMEKVEVYVDGKLRATLHDEYTWTWSDFGSHTLTVAAYDQQGLNATDFANAFLVA